eukprot:gene3343-3832_t
MSDSESERQRKLKAGRAKLMEFKQMKKRKKKEESASASVKSASVKSNSSRSASGQMKRDVSITGSREVSHSATGDQDTENDAVSLGSATGSQAASPIPLDALSCVICLELHKSYLATDNSYTSGSEYTSADESYSTDDGGVDSYVVANLERNELKNRVIELEENLRGKQAVLKELNKENFELRAKLHNVESGSRQQSSPSPILKRELDSLQDTLNDYQKKLEEMNKENHEMRAKLNGSEDKSALSKIEELRLSLGSKQEMLEALNAQNEQLVNENQRLKSRTKDISPDSSHSESQIESLQENLKTKQSILTELNRQNQELRDKLAGSSLGGQTEKYERTISDLKNELGLKDDELEKLKAMQVSFVQTKEMLKDATLQSQQTREELEKFKRKYQELQTESQTKQNEFLTRATQSEIQLEKLQSEYHKIVAINNDNLMKIEILEGQISDTNDELQKKDRKIIEMDTQVELAVGERDAVQLEARTQVEDFQDRVKEMQEQLQKNDAVIREYEEKMSSASEELIKTKNIVTESERLLARKDEEFVALQRRTETVQGNEHVFAEEIKKYQEEIENVKNEAEKKQSELFVLRGEIEDLKGKYGRDIAEKDNAIEELNKKMSEDQNAFSLEMQDIGDKYNSLLENQQIESEKLLKTEKEKWQAEMKDALDEMKKDNEDEMLRKVNDLQEMMNARLDESKAKIDDLEELLSNKDDSFAKLNRELEVQTSNCEGLRSELKESNDTINELESLVVEANEEFSLKEAELSENLQKKIAKLVELEKLLNERSTTLDSTLEELAKAARRADLADEELNALKKKFEQEKAELESTSNEKFNAGEEERNAEKIILQEENNRLKNMVEERNEIESALRSNIKLLEDQNDIVNNEKENLAHMLEVVKDNSDKLEKNIEETKMENSKLITEVGDLQGVRDNLIAEKMQLLQFVEEKKNELEVSLNGLNCAKEEYSKLEKEKNDVCSDYDAEIRLLKERLDLVTKEHNAETVNLFSQNLAKVEAEKNEQIQTLKEEISHLKESFDKQVNKLHADYESDAKQLEDDNERLRTGLKELKESNEKDRLALDNSARMEVDALNEAHKMELEKLRGDLTKRYEEEELKLKEDHWQELKKLETERDKEVKTLLENQDRDKNEAIELLRQEMEETKNKEIHDVVCSMTKENKENAALLRQKMEEQLASVQAQKDEELQNIQQEYQHNMQKKRDEIEDMMSSQIVKYEEEHSILRNRLKEADESIHALTNEKADLLNDIARTNAAFEEERSKRALAEEDLVHLKEDNKLLKKSFQDTVAELGRVGGTKTKKLEEQDEVDASVEEVVEEKLQSSAADVYEESERLLDEELRTVTKLCKQQIEELTEKLNLADNRAEENERKYNESFLQSEVLIKSVKDLEIELDVSRQELKDMADLNVSLTERSIEINEQLENLQVKETVEDAGRKQAFNDELLALAAEIELKMKQKAELDESLSEAKFQVERLGKNVTEKQIVFEEAISAATAAEEETWVVPEVLNELEVSPMSVDAYDDAGESMAPATSERDLEIKHLQTMLVENNEKLELQKKEIVKLQEALESERVLFAEQLRARKIKEEEQKTVDGELASEAAMRERRDLMNKIAMLEQRLSEREQAESELRDENWKLVNLLKDNNIELFTEKDLLQEQLIKQEEIIQDLQLQMSTSDLVSGEIQEAFGRQMAALHRQRDALLDQLEQHKQEHQGFAKVIQEKAALEDRLREERLLLSEKLKQKEALEIELATERAALHEKIIELEKLRENLIGKEKFAAELSEQRDELKMELDAIEERLKIKEESLVVEREELERELEQKDSELRKWEDDFKSRELEFIQNEESLKQNFDHVLESTRVNLERRHEESLGQLRTDLDADYMGRMELLENGLHVEYGQRISRLNDEHQDQLKNWLELSDWLLESLLTLPCFKMNRAKSGFEERLLDLRRQLEEERQRQVGTLKTVLEREHSSEIMDLDTGHSSEIDELKEELSRKHELEIDQLKQSLQATHQEALEDLQSSMLTESAIQLAAVRLQAEIDAAVQIEKMQSQMEGKVKEKVKQMQTEQEENVATHSTAKERMDVVLREMKLIHHDEFEESKDDSSGDIQEQIHALEEQFKTRHNEELRHAELELAARYDKEMDKLKYGITQQHGEGMFGVMSQFEAEQENYFKERLHYIQVEHENEMEQMSREHELVLLKTKNELDVLREEDFQRIRKLQDEIYAKEEEVLELRIAYDQAEKLLQGVSGGVERKEDVVLSSVLVKSGDNNVESEEVAKLRDELQQALMEKNVILEEAQRDIEIFRKEMEDKYEDELQSIVAENNIIQSESKKEINYFKSQLEKSQRDKELMEKDFDNRLNYEMNRIVAEKDDMIRQCKAENSDLGSLLNKALLEKEMLEEDFKMRLNDEVIRLEKENWRAEQDRVISGLRVNLEQQLIQLSDQHEHKYQELQEKYDAEVSKKGVQYPPREDDIRVEVENRQWAQDDGVYGSELEVIKQKHEEELREQDNRHKEELREAVVQLSTNLKSDFNNVMFDIKNKYEQEKEELRREFDEEKDTELRLLRSQLYFEMDGKIVETQRKCEQEKLEEIAKVTTQLSMKSAVESENRKEAELDAVRREMQEDYSRNAFRQAAEIEQLETRHADELKKAKYEADKIMQEKMQEWQTEVNLLKSLLEGQEKPIEPATEDFVDAGRPYEKPIVPATEDFVDAGRPYEKPIVPATENFVDAGRPYEAGPVDYGAERSREPTMFQPPGAHSLDVEDNATVSGSTETLIARFADGRVESVLRDVQDVASSGGGSRYSGDSSRHSFGGSAPNLFHSATPNAPPWEGDFYHDQIRREQDSRLSEMRERFRSSSSDNSGKSGDQKMEGPLMEEGEKARLLQEKDDEMRMFLMKQKEEFDLAYLGRIQQGEMRIHDLERDLAQAQNYIHQLNEKHFYEMNELKNKSLQLAEEKIKEVQEESAHEREELRKQEEEKTMDTKVELSKKHQKMLNKLIEDQKKEMDVLRNDHIEELAMLKHELNMKQDRELKDLSEKQGVYVLQTRERYEKLLREEREKHADDTKRLRKAMDSDLDEKQKTIMKVVKEQYESELKHEKHRREMMEADHRRVIDDLTKDHMVEMDRAKEVVRRELATDRDRVMEDAQRQTEAEHILHLRSLEDKLEETHILQLQTLQDIQEKHRLDIEDLKREHEKEKLELLNKDLQTDLGTINELDKAKQELEEAHKKEIEQLTNELKVASSRIVALEAMKSGSEATYLETIDHLKEEYEHEITKLKESVDKIKMNQLESLERRHADVHNADQRIIKQNFEQQFSEMRQHYELLMADMKRNYEQQKKHAVEEQAKNYEKKMNELNALYEEDSQVLTNHIVQLNEEHYQVISDAKEKLKHYKSENDELQKKCKELKDENTDLGNKARITDDQYNTLIARHERQEEENSKYISMLSSDVEKCELSKTSLKRTNDRLLQLLSDAVRASMITEESINRHLDELIQETSRSESGVDVSGLRGAARSARRHPDGDNSFRSHRGTHRSPKKDKSRNSPDVTQYSNLSEGSLLSDEGLELSLLSRENLFQGPEIDQHTEDMVRGAGERLHTAVDHVLKMLSTSTKQTTDTRQSIDEMLARSSQLEQEQSVQREKLAEELKKALKEIEDEKKSKADWEKEARKKHADHEAMKKEHAELKKEHAELKTKIESLEKEGHQKEQALRSTEEKLLELETEKEILSNLKTQLELKLAELKAHSEKDSHDVRRENEDLKARLARATKLSGDELDGVIVEMEDLRENIHSLSYDKEALKSQMKEAKDQLAETGAENERLRQNISEVLQSNIELIQQNEGLKGKISSLESALDETLAEQMISPERAATFNVENDFVNGVLDVDGGSKSAAVSALREEVTSLKECLESLKRENENLCCNLEEKVENELELINKVSELESELYKSANEGFESYDSDSLLRKSKTMERKLKGLTEENEKIAEELQDERRNIQVLRTDLSKANELVSDRNSLYDELMKFKSALLSKEDDLSQVKHDAEVASLALSDKRREEQQKTINEQHSKILSLLQKQSSDELTEQYISQLQEEIEHEKEMILEKDGEIELLLQRLSQHREGEEEDKSRTQSFVASHNALYRIQVVDQLEERLSQQEVEIMRLREALQSSEQEQQRSQQANEVNLQKALHHVKKEMEHANRLRIAKLKEEHQAEMDRLLEISKLDYSDLGQRFEEQVGAAERVNLEILEQFFRNREMNDSQAVLTGETNAPVQSLLNDLESEAEKIAQLVTSYETATNKTGNIEELQHAWSKEKQILLEAVKALKELVARASHTAAAESNENQQDWRAALLAAVEEVFKQEQNFHNAELETLERTSGKQTVSAEAISNSKQHVAKKDGFYNTVMKSLDNKDRESLIGEIVHLSRMVKDLQTSIDEYKFVLNDFQVKVEERETALAHQLESQANVIEQEKTNSSQLKTQLEAEKTRSGELEKRVKDEKAILAEMKTALASDDEKINDLISSLENERIELNELKTTLASEQLKSGSLSEQLQAERERSSELKENLDAERRQIEDLTRKESSNVEELEKLLAMETERSQNHIEMINDLTEERNRLEQAAAMEQNHAKKIEELCEDLKSKAGHEKSERQRLEKIAERYHANLEEMSKLFESEKQRRLDNERLLDDHKQHRIEAEEKGQSDEMEKEKLEESLKEAKNDVDVLKSELDRANLRLTEIQSENAINLAETEKQNAERMKEVLEKAKRSAADEIERERATCVQLREALKSLQLKYETSRSQLERMKESAEQSSVSEKEASSTRTSPTGSNRFSVSSRVMDPFVNRCSKLISHCQDVIKSEQQRMKHGEERPSSRHMKELQASNDALAALSHELSDLQSDLRALEQGDHTSGSPLARLEQAHNKNDELRDHIRKLVSEKSELRNTLKSLEEQIMQYRNREADLEQAAKYANEEANLKLKSEQMKWQAEREAIEHSLKMASVENENLRNGQIVFEAQKSEEGSKLSESGWTIQKIQKLYGRCVRAESFRKALIYQKKYLLFLLGGFQETEAITLSMIAKMDGHSDHAGRTQYGKSRAFMRFRTAARVVMATWRMKFLVKKWNKSVSKAAGKVGGRRSDESKTSPSAPPETISEKTSSVERFYFPKQNSLSANGYDTTSDPKSESMRRKKSFSKRADVPAKSHDVNSNLRKQRGQNGHDSQSKLPKENGHSTRHDRFQTAPNDYPSYSAVRNLDMSPPRAYPRPTSPRLNRDSPPVLDTDYGHYHTSRPRSPMSQGSIQRGVDSPSKHRRSLSASGLEETNTSLNAYIKKLESLQARLKAQ